MSDRDDTVSGSLGERETDQSLPGGLYITLEVIEGPDKGTKFELSSARTVLGRREADVVLSDPTVSGKHAVIEVAANRVFITDNGSTNGTRVNSEAIESSPLSNMDVIQLGDTSLLLSVVEDKYGAYVPGVSDEDSGEARLSDDESTVVIGPLPNPAVAENIQVILDAIAGPDRGGKFKVSHRSTVIGRGDDADFKVDDSTVSKRHCQIEIHNKDKMTIKDLASANGTRVNDQYISAVKIRHGDLIHIGETQIRILINIRR